MHRSSLATLILLLGGFGCRQSTHPKVYVDFEAVLASYKASPLPSHPLPKPPAGLPATTLSVGAVPPRTVVVEGTSEVQGQHVVEENRRKAVAELTRLLSDRYIREANRAGRERIAALQPVKQAAMEAAQNQVQAEFVAYAQKRGMLVAQLTSLVGFPDPNPSSLPPAATVPAFVQARLNRAAELRKQINVLDADYQKRVTDVTSAAGRKYNTDLAAEIAQMNEDRVAAIARAQNEAVTEAAKTYKSIAPLILGPTQVDLPGQPAQSVTLPAVPAPINAPPVREQTLTPDQRRAILQSQLQMWLALNGYELAKSPSDGRDATAEFIKWRQERNL